MGRASMAKPWLTCMLKQKQKSREGTMNELEHSLLEPLPLELPDPWSNLCPGRPLVDHLESNLRLGQPLVDHLNRASLSRALVELRLVEPCVIEVKSTCSLEHTGEYWKIK